MYTYILQDCTLKYLRLDAGAPQGGHLDRPGELPCGRPARARAPGPSSVAFGNFDGHDSRDTLIIALPFVRARPAHLTGTRSDARGAATPAARAPWRPLLQEASFRISPFGFNSIGDAGRRLKTLRVSMIHANTHTYTRITAPYWTPKNMDSTTGI
ncbi:hypothetical protein EVAR_22314_1 [Eumeta japonica]|uniref:Uncharacterized protein n=1 Tax=Eumeta variegata TaxID=151549 RepID=A0A4C1UBY7_EUMVA|nr:hypothetical protein EVAR_22314_1 [Eumeta japonica]